MERIRRIAGMSKPKAPSVVQKDKADESVVFFRELYKREKDRDVNLLEPMYSVEFDAIQGGHVPRVPSGKRDFLIPVDEKHDYDWLMTPPAAPLFPSVEVEARSSKTLSSKQEGAKIPARSSASHAATTSSSKITHNVNKGTPAASKEKKQVRTEDQRSSHKASLKNGQQKAAAAAATAPPKKHSERCYASQEVPYQAPKNLITTTARSLFRRRHASPAAVDARSKDPGVGVDVKKGSGKARRQSCPPAATRGTTELRLQDDRRNGSEQASGAGGRAGRATLTRGIARAEGRAWT
ncbi:hypothetical protein U9M48_037963 [Paspalum notatum var. saurae]|uniref:Uncharacterized protein n=1 Tax=Paspalum notatum var. saurae TaxID=547442 RepID=A0AAQ3XB72_PASNO